MSKSEVFIKGAKNLINSFKYAFWGIYKSFKSERNMKIHCLAVILIIILGFVYQRCHRFYGRHKSKVTTAYKNIGIVRHQSRCYEKKHSLATS